MVRVNLVDGSCADIEGMVHFKNPSTIEFGLGPRTNRIAAQRIPVQAAVSIISDGNLYVDGARQAYIYNISPHAVLRVLSV
jgi:hypothetical protein